MAFALKLHLLLKSLNIQTADHVAYNSFYEYKFFLNTILSLKELESFRKVSKNLLFESSYAASVHFSPANFTRLALTGKFIGFRIDQSHGQVTTLSLNSWETYGKKT